MDVRILAGGLAQLGQHGTALRVVRGSPSGQDQPARHVLPREAEGGQRTLRLGGARVGGDLQEDRPVPRDAEAIQDLPHLGTPEVAVLLGEGVDRRVDHEHRDADALRELRHGVHHGVVVLEVAAHEVPRAPPGPGEVGMAAPDPPSPLRPVAHQGQCGQIVDHQEVGVETKRRRVRRGGLHVGDQHGLRDRGGVTGECGLERPRRPVERRVAHDHLPGRVDAQVLEHRHEPGQDLRRPAAVSARVDVDEAPALEPLGQLQEEVDRAARRHLPVLLQPDARRTAFGRWGHRPAPAARASSRSARSRARACSRLPA